MADEKQGEKGEQDKVNILLEDIPDYLYDQIKTAAEQTGTTIHEWIMGACRIRISNQFRHNLLASGKGYIEGGGSGTTVI